MFFGDATVKATRTLSSDVGGIVKARQVLLLTQAFFFLSLLICLSINHGRTAQTDGISFYGVYHGTAAILVMGFAASAAGLWRAASYFAEVNAPRLASQGLRVVALGLIALLATPYNRGTFLNWTHMTVGVVVALLQLALSLRLLTRRQTLGSIVGFTIQLAGGLIAAASLPNWNFPYLLQGETIYQIGFGWCLIEWTHALGARRSDPT